MLLTWFIRCLIDGICEIRKSLYVNLKKTIKVIDKP